MTWLSPSSKTHTLAWFSIESCMAHVVVIGEISIFAADGFRWPSCPGRRAGLVGGGGPAAAWSTIGRGCEVGASTAARVPVDRASPADLMQLATDVGPAPMHVGAVLVLGTGPGFSVQDAQRLLGERVRAVPRLRQRLCRAPPGCGRPFWADDPAFDLRHHVRQMPCPPPGDQRALLDVAAAVAGEPLPWSRPLWSATFVTGLADGGTGLVIVMNHVLADGIGGLAVLARLVDEAPGLPPGSPQAAGFPVPAPRVGERGPGTPPPAGYRAAGREPHPPAWPAPRDRRCRPRARGS